MLARYETFPRMLASALVLPLLVLALMAPTLRAQDEAPQAPVKKDVPYVPTPQDVVDKMLELADPREGEVLYDLGCGDGRIVVTAAKKYGVKGTGVDIDPERIKESNENAEKEGVTDKVEFVIKDLFKMDFKDADIVTLYLLPAINERLRPQLLALKPGTRIVSHAFSMGDWEPEEEVTMDPGGQTVYFWIIPAKAEGSHTVKIQGKDGKAQQAKLDLKQKYQKVTGTATIGGKQVKITDGRLRGRKLTFTADGQKYTATIGGNEEAARTAGERQKGGNGKSNESEQQDDAGAAADEGDDTSGAGESEDGASDRE